MEQPAYIRATPIAALATPPGESALAVIRLSGEGTLKLLAAHFSRPKTLLAAPGNTTVYGWIVDTGADGPERVDETLVTVYRAPQSYTGEEAAEITCHGGFSAPAAVMRLLLHSGFSAALRGEFSYRAFMNGKLDLSRAEAVMEIVSAKGDAARAASIKRLAGTLEHEITAIKNSLAAILAEVELHLDYSEIDGAFAGPGGPGEDASPSAKTKADAALARLDALLALYQSRRLERAGALVVIAGKPNAGKSSLFNLLLNEERAIVSAAPGTTRDWIEGWIELDGLAIRLVDTAGLRAAASHVEQLGIDRSAALIDQEDLVLYLIDSAEEALNAKEGRIFAASPQKPGFPLQSFRAPAQKGFPLQSLAREERRFAAPAKGQTAALTDTAAASGSRAEKRRLFAWNKCDQTPMPSGLCINGEACLELSAKTGAGIAALLAAIPRALRQSATPAAGGAALPEAAPACAAGAGTERQRALIAGARDNLSQALDLAAKDAPLDIIAPRLRDAIDNLGEITGEVSSAAILETMFNTFCVGK